MGYAKFAKIGGLWLTVKKLTIGLTKGDDVQQNRSLRNVFFA